MNQGGGRRRHTAAKFATPTTRPIPALNGPSLTDRLSAVAQHMASLFENALDAASCLSRANWHEMSQTRPAPRLATISPVAARRRPGGAPLPQPPSSPLGLQRALTSPIEAIEGREVEAMTTAQERFARSRYHPQGERPKAGDWRPGSTRRVNGRGMVTGKAYAIGRAVYDVVRAREDHPARSSESLDRLRISTSGSIDGRRYQSTVNCDDSGRRTAIPWHFVNGRRRTRR